MDLMSMLRMKSLFDPLNPQNKSQDLLPGMRDANLGNIGRDIAEPQMDAGTASFGQNDVAKQTAAKSAAPVKVSANLDLEDISTIFEAIRKLSNTKSDEQDKLSQLIDNMPRAANESKRSWFQKFNASMYGASQGLSGKGDAYDSAYKMSHPQYNQGMKEWKDEITPREKLAGLENQDNTSNRMMAQNAATTFLGNRRADDLATQNNIKNKQADERIRQTDARNAVARLSALGGTIQFRSDGQPIIVHRDGSISEIPTEMMSAEQLAKLKARTGSPLRPNEIAREKFDRIQALLALHPEWEQWLHPGQNNTYKLDAVDEPWDLGQLGKLGGNGLDAATRNKILAEIEGKPTLKPGIPDKPGAAAPSPNTLPTPLPGHILMYNSNGELGNVPEDQVERALKAGYKKAGGTESPF